MLTNIEHAIVITALVWGVVQLVKHFAPDFYSREEMNIYGRFQKSASELEARVAELEKKLGVK
ncbi:gal4p-like zipper protein [Caudoviricetes sp.]|nr:gal4p-like zipper protein [Caudoviricetes sp.]